MVEHDEDGAVAQSDAGRASMAASGSYQMELNVARYRLVLAPAAVIAVYVDPGQPLLSRMVPLVSGLFLIDTYFVALMAMHVAYSACAYAALSRHRVAPARMASWTTWIDVLFGTAAGLLTEGSTSPAYPFFAFAVVAAGLHAGLRQALWVTAACVVLYESLIMVSAGASAEAYIMRPVYLAITGYLVGSLGQQRLDLQDEISRFEVSEQRHRIGRDLHDNFTQALAAISLRLESWRRQLHTDPSADVLPDLIDLQQSVKRQADDLRTYTRSLAGVEAGPDDDAATGTTHLRVVADVSASPMLLDHILLIVREGVSNIRRHAHASNATIEICSDPSGIRVSIEDDGIGFHTEVPPWSIASRARELGGQVQLVAGAGGGARLVITVPQG